MTLDQINYVIELGRTGSFSRASNNLFISQSALSLAILIALANNDIAKDLLNVAGRDALADNLTARPVSYTHLCWIMSGFKHGLN